MLMAANTVFLINVRQNLVQDAHGMAFFTGADIAAFVVLVMARFAFFNPGGVMSFFAVKYLDVVDFAFIMAIGAIGAFGGNC